MLQVSAGRGGAVFDEDPKRWRLIAEFFTTIGRALEIATAVFPQNFVLLAGDHLEWLSLYACTHAVVTTGTRAIIVNAIFPQNCILLAGENLSHL